MTLQYDSDVGRCDRHPNDNLLRAHQECELTCHQSVLCRRRLDSVASGDEGIGLILVIGISAVMAILLAVFTATAIRSLSSSAEHVSFEQSLAAAEAGIDEELATSRLPGTRYRA